MPDMTDGLLEATQQLERAVEELGSQPGERGDVSGASLAMCLHTLVRVREEAERTAVGSLDLVRLEARAAENIDLAALSLERQEGAADERDVGALQDALFHARRALDYLQRFVESLTERTRTADRERNRKEFMSG